MERRDHGKNLEMVKTKLFGPSSAAYFTYNRVTWRLIVRKEVNAWRDDMNIFEFNSLHFYGVFIILYTLISFLSVFNLYHTRAPNVVRPYKSSSYEGMVCVAL
jgi:hypothetical protein